MGRSRLDVLRRIALLTGGCVLLAGCGLTPDEEADAIEQGILASPGAEDLWAAIKAGHPDDFAVLVEQLRALTPEERADPERSKQIAAEWLRDFFVRIGPDAVKAPAAAMLEWSATEGDLYASLQHASADQCAAMTMGDWVYFDEQDEAVKAAIARRNTAMVRAATAGRDTPHIYQVPQEADFAALGEAIAATGIDPDLQAALGSDETMQALSPEDQCKVGVAVYTGMTALPDDVEPRVAAYMLSPL